MSYLQTSATELPRLGSAKTGLDAGAPSSLHCAAGRMTHVGANNRTRKPFKPTRWRLRLTCYGSGSSEANHELLSLLAHLPKLAV